MRRTFFCAAAVISVLVLASCGTTTTLTSAGSSVRLVTEGERDCCCEQLGIVTGSSGAASNKSDLESAYNELRNEAAALGGNAIFVLDRDTHTGFWSGTTSTTASGEALRCDFQKIKESKETKK